MNRKEWLENIKAGDEVVIMHDASPSTVALVERVTKTLIVANKGRFSRKTGNEVPHDPWSRYDISIVPVTDERMAAVRRRRQRYANLSVVMKWNYNNASDETLEKVVAAIREEYQSRLDSEAGR